MWYSTKFLTRAEGSNKTSDRLVDLTAQFNLFLLAQSYVILTPLIGRIIYTLGSAHEKLDVWNERTIYPAGNFLYGSDESGTRTQKIALITHLQVLLSTVLSDVELWFSTGKNLIISAAYSIGPSAHAASSVKTWWTKTSINSLTSWSVHAIPRHFLAASSPFAPCCVNLGPSIFFCSSSYFRAITRLERLATQATQNPVWRGKIKTDWPRISGYRCFS